MTDSEKLPLPNQSGLADSTNGTPTPSNLSVMEEKERDMGEAEIQSEADGENTLEPIQSSEYPSPSKLAGILIGVALCMFLVSLDMTIVATAIPRITDQFKSLEDVGWYGSGFFLTFAAFQSMWGSEFLLQKLVERSIQRLISLQKRTSTLISNGSICCALPSSRSDP